MRWLFLFLLAGCAPGPTPGDPSAASECGGHGHLHGTACHCDRGYEAPVEDQGTCVPVGSGDGAAGGSSGGAAGGGAAVTPEGVTLEPTMAQGRYASTHGGGEVWRYGARSGTFTLSIESYTEYGGPTRPGPFTLRPEDASLATCGTCLLLRRGSERYLPVVTAGATVTFSALGRRAGERFSGTVDRALEFRQVTIDGQTYATSDVPNGKRLSVAPFPFDVALVSPECGGYGHRHGSTCHCDPGYQLDPTNPLNCVPR
ncbi:MAG: hypothetical protein INH41_09995 [Myxococcaceae bacterium]|jgi:hypothetical protein|nr:hypothetical protein [Myxococcaceae bacterium]